MALLQDLGMLALVQTQGDSYQSMVAKAGTEHRQLIEVEQEQLGIDHPQLGSALAEKWNLPQLLINSIHFHENPSSAPDDCRRFILAVALGGYVADVFIRDSHVDALEAYFELA